MDNLSLRTLCISLLLVGFADAKEVTLVQVQMALASPKLDAQVLYDLAFQQISPEMKAALHESFEERVSKEDKQEIAKALVESGDLDSKYFDFLAGFAEQLRTRRVARESTPQFSVTVPRQITMLVQSANNLRLPITTIQMVKVQSLPVPLLSLTKVTHIIAL